MAYYLPWLSNASGYNVQARVDAFIARHKEVRVDAGESNTSSFEGNVTLPTAPTITSYANAGSLAAFNAARVNGVEITLTASFTGTLNVSGYTDMRVIFPTGVEITAPSDSPGITIGTATRLQLLGTGGTVVGNLVTTGGASDIHIKGMIVTTRTNSASPQNDMMELNDIDKLLIESSLLQSDSWCPYHYYGTYCVFANSSFIGTNVNQTHGCARGGVMTTSLWMDCRMRAETLGFGWRIHHETTRAAVWNCQVEGVNAALGALNTNDFSGVNVYDIVVIDNNLWSDGTVIFLPEYADPVPTGVDLLNVSMATIVDNTGYTDYAGDSGSQMSLGGTPGTSWITGDGTQNPRNAYSAPPAWSRQ